MASSKSRRNEVSNQNNKFEAFSRDFDGNFERNLRHPSLSSISGASNSLKVAKDHAED
jgi:hypothetical protein